MKEKTFRKVKPCGMFYSQGKEYFLLYPRPIEGDGWQRDILFLGVPVTPISSPGEPELFSSARHLVSPAYLIDYKPNMQEINIWLREEDEVEAEPDDLYEVLKSEDYLKELEQVGQADD